MNKKLTALVLAASAALSFGASAEKVEAQEVDTNTVINSDTVSTKSGQKAKVVNVSTSLRIRQSPSTDSTVLGSIGAGKVVDILGTSGSWYKLKYNGIIGYSHSDYLQITSSGSSGENLGTDSVSGKTGQVINVSTNLRIRSGAGTGYSIVGYLYPNDTCTIAGESGSWYKVNKNGKIGYVHKDYIKVIGNSNGGSIGGSSGNVDVIPDSGKGKVVNVSTSLRVRQSPSTSSSVVGQLYPGNVVDIVGKSGSWYKINANGKIGFVHSDYLTKVNSDSGSNSGSGNGDVTPDSGKGKVVNVSTSLRVRQSPSTSSVVVGYLYGGDMVDIVGKSGVWYKINTNGKIGFVHSDYLTKVNSGSGSNGGNPGSDGGQVGTTYQRVLDIMKAHIGTPYVFGGSGEEITTSLLNSLQNRYPNQKYSVSSSFINSGYRAFDCSGLMQWAFRQVGVNLGRSTYDQIKNGYEVSAKDAKPGDLLFYGNLSHVGMYIGNGQWIESPRTGETVRISNVPWNVVSRGRRVI